MGDDSRNSVTIGESDRILIRTWDIKRDLKPWMSLSQDSGLNKFSISGYRMKDESAGQIFIKYWVEYYEKTKLGVFPIFLKPSSEMIGICALKQVKLDGENDQRTEIMYRLAEHQWGNGYATESAKLLIHYGFKVLELQEIIGFTVPENSGSRSVLQRIDMKFVKNASSYGFAVELYRLGQEDFK